MATPRCDLAPLDPPTLERARRALVRRDERLACVIRRAGPCRIEPGGDAYAGLLRAVVHQPLAGAAAAAIEGRVRALGRGGFPRPRALLALSDAALRSTGLSRAKLDSLRGVAEAFASRRLSGPTLARMNYEDVTATVVEVRGLGPWAAHMPASPDHKPIALLLDESGGLCLATGNSRRGMYYAAGTGRLVTDLLTGRAQFLAVVTFGLERFANAEECA